MSQKSATLKNEIRAPKQEEAREKKQKKRAGSSGIKLEDKLKMNPKLKRVLGLTLLSFGVYLSLSLVSFLFSWKFDQSLIRNLDWETVKAANPDMAHNWMGIFGAWLSHLLIYRWFGIASFIIVPLILVSGFKYLTENKNIRLLKYYSLSALAISFLSLFFGYVSNQMSFLAGNGLDYLGGAMGYEVQYWLGGLLGSLGVGILLGIALLSFLIIMFNISFRMPSLAKMKEDMIYSAYRVGDNGSIVESEGHTKDNAGATVMEDEDDEDIEIDEDDFKLVVLPEKSAVSPADGVNPHEKEKAPDVDFKVNSAVPKKAANLSGNEVLGENEAPSQGSWYQYPPLSILRNHESTNAAVDTRELQERKDLIVETLENYKIKIDKIEATIGPTVTLYEIVPAAGVRISRIKSLEDDIALSLAALGIRIIAPIPGKGTIGIEVPNQHPEIVSLKEALSSEEFRTSKMDLPIALGKTISNGVFVADLAKMPHLLMAGATGQGKSVGINTIIASILYKKHPEDVKFVLVDPKKVELSLFKLIEKHFLPELPDGQEAIITDTQMVVHVLKSLCVEMDKRYDLLKDAQVRNIKEYNKKIEKGQLDTTINKRLPYIILVIDELADLMMTAGKEVELPIARLAQLARAIGIHLIVATQRPSVNIITGIIKANFPARIAFRVTSRIDSRTILDTGGAEQLIGRGDMLYSTGNDIIRLQCPFIDTEEVEELTAFIGKQPYPEPFRLRIITDEDGGSEFDDFDDDMDPLFEDAARLIVNTQQGSTSMLQRKLKLGYNRAGRLMDQLERARIVGGNEGSKAREVLVGDEMALEQFLKDLNLK